MKLSKSLATWIILGKIWMDECCLTTDRHHLGRSVFMKDVANCYQSNLTVRIMNSLSDGIVRPFKYLVSSISAGDGGISDWIIC